MPTFFVRKPEDFEFYLNQQLDCFQLDEFDFYFIQGLNKHSWQIAQKFNLLERAENAMKAGKFGYLGFSFHDDLETFKTIIDGTDLWFGHYRLPQSHSSHAGEERAGVFEGY